MSRAAQRIVRAGAVAAVLVGALLILSGCQSASERDYVAEVEQLSAETSNSLRALDAGADPEETTQALRDLDEQIAAFERLTPPQSARRAHEHLVSALRKLRTGLQRMNAPAGDAAAARAGNKTVRAALDDVKTSIDELDREL